MTGKETLMRTASIGTEPDSIRPGQFWSVKSGRELLSFVATHAECAAGLPAGAAFRFVPVTARLGNLMPGDFRVRPSENDIAIPMAAECWAEMPMLKETLFASERRFHGMIHPSVMREMSAYLDRGGAAIDAGNVDSERMGSPIAMIDPRAHRSRLDEFRRFSMLVAPAVSRISGISERMAWSAVVRQYLSLNPAAPHARDAKDDFHFRLAVRKFDAYDCSHALFFIDRVLKSHPTHLPAIWMDIRCREELGMPSVVDQYKLFAEKFPKQKIWNVACVMATLQSPLNPDRKMEEMVRDCLGEKQIAVFARLLLVKILRRSGRLEEASREARRLVNLKSKDPFVYRIAAIDIWRTDEKLALRFLKKSIELQPADPAGYAKVGEVNRKLGRFDEASRWLQKAYLLDPRDVGNLNEIAFLEREQNDFARAKTWLKRALEIDPDNASTLAQMGYICRDLREWDESLGWFMKCHNLLPKNLWTVRQIAYVYRDMKKYSKAVEWMEKAHRLNPRNVRTLQRLAFVLRDVRDDARADKALMKAYRIDPNNTHTIGWISDSFRSRGLYEQAVKWAEVGRKVNPSDIFIIRRIIRLYILMGKHDQAEQAARRAMEIKVDECRAWLYTAEIAIFRGQDDEARTRLEQVLAEIGRSARPARTVFERWPLLTRADIEKYRGKIGGIKSSFASYALMLLGGVHLRAGENREAVKCFHRALAADPSNPQPNRGLALAYEALKDAGRARIYRALFDESAELAAQKTPANDWVLWLEPPPKDVIRISLVVDRPQHPSPRSAAEILSSSRFERIDKPVRKVVFKQG